jgi:transposase
VIQTPKLEARIIRYELADHEWVAIKPMLPNKPRGVPRVNDRRVLNGIFWILRSGAPWRDMPAVYGPYTTCYNRFVRWRRAGVWGRIIDALAAPHDAAVQMIDTSIVRVHQHGACIARNERQSMGRSRGGLTSKIHAVVDSNGLPVQLALSPGETHGVRLAEKLLSRLKSGAMLLADRGYDADWIRELAMKKGAWANIPPKSNRRDPICFSPYLYRARNQVERFFNRIKQCRRVATRYDRLAANCESARGPDADRHVKPLIQFAVEGSLSGAYSHVRQISPKGHSRSFKRCANHIRSILMNKRALSAPAYLKSARGGDGIRDQPVSAVAAPETEPSFRSALRSLRCDGPLDSLRRA